MFIVSDLSGMVIHLQDFIPLSDHIDGLVRQGALASRNGKCFQLRVILQQFDDAAGQ